MAIGMKKYARLLEKPYAAYTFAACSAVVLFMLLSNLDVINGWISGLGKLLSPVFTGIAVAYLFNPLSDFFERKWLKKIKKDTARHLWAVILTIVILVLALTLLLVSLIPSVIKSVSTLVDNWDSYTAKIEQLIQQLSAFLVAHDINFDLSSIEDFVDNSMQKLISLVKDNVKPILSTLGSVGTSVSNFGIGVLFGFCFLIAKSGLLRLIAALRAALIRKERIERHNELFERCHSVFIRYVGCTLLDALIVGFATLVFLLVMRMPYAPLIAMLVAITNIIPTFGPMIGSAFGIFFLVLEKPLNALLFFIFICILQSLDGMVIKPRLFKGSLGIPGVWTLVLIVLGGKIAGMAGIILAIPAAAILVILYHETVAPRLKKRAAKINDALPEEAPAEDARELST